MDSIPASKQTVQTDKAYSDIWLISFINAFTSSTHAWSGSVGAFVAASAGLAIPIFLMTSHAQRTELNEQGSYPSPPNAVHYSNSELREHLSIKQDSRLCFIVNNVLVCGSEETRSGLYSAATNTHPTLILIIHSFLMSLCFSFLPTYLDMTAELITRTLSTAP